MFLINEKYNISNEKTLQPDFICNQLTFSVLHVLFFNSSLFGVAELKCIQLKHRRLLLHTVFPKMFYGHLQFKIYNSVLNYLAQIQASLTLNLREVFLSLLLYVQIGITFKCQVTFPHIWQFHCMSGKQTQLSSVTWFKG